MNLKGNTYQTVEHAYQAAKTTEDRWRAVILACETPGEAKKAGRALQLREDWDDVKDSIMETLLRKKFYDPLLRAALIQTGSVELVELNYWHDNYWGECSCNGCKAKIHNNRLGILLMRTRANCQITETSTPQISSGSGSR